MKNYKGFTLIELAIVLVIMGLLVTMGLGLFKITFEQEHTKETMERLRANKYAIIGYALSERKLPPDPTIPYTKDSFNRPIMYIYDQNLTTQDICSINNTNITLKLDCDQNNNCDENETKEDVAFIFVSGGKNLNIQIGSDPGLSCNYINGLYICSVTTNTTIYSYRRYDSNVVVDGFTGDYARPQKYDDLILRMTLVELIGRVCPPPDKKTETVGGNGKGGKGKGGNGPKRGPKW